MSFMFPPPSSPPPSPIPRRLLLLSPIQFTDCTHTGNWVKNVLQLFMSYNSGIIYITDYTEESILVEISSCSIRLDCWTHRVYICDCRTHSVYINGQTTCVGTFCPALTGAIHRPSCPSAIFVCVYYRFYHNSEYIL